MAKKFSDLIADLPKRASKIDPDQALSIFGHELYHDLKEIITSRYPSWMMPTQEITIDTTTATEYNLDDSIGQIFKVEDQNGDRVYRGNITSNDTDKDMIQVYGRKIRVNADCNHTKLIVHAYRRITELENQSSEIPYPEDIVEDFWKIWIKGIAYFYFRDRKKTTEVTFIFNEYDDLKKALYVPTVLSIGK